MLDRRQLLSRIFASSLYVFLPKPKGEAAKERIYLNSFLIAGYRYYDGEKIEEALKPGAILRLIREPGNIHDKRAIEIYRGRWKIGYVPRKENKVISNIMDQGYSIAGVIDGIYQARPTWKRMRVSIYLENIRSTEEAFLEAV